MPSGVGSTDMRAVLLPLLLVLLSAAWATSVQAQGASPVLTLQVTVPSAAIEAGNATPVGIEVTRICANPVQVLEAQDVHISITADGSAWTIDGPMRGRFDRQVCATQPQLSIPFDYQAIADDSARGGQHSFHVLVGADAAGPTTPQIPDTPQAFVIAVAEEPELPPVPTSETDQEAPGLGWLAPFLGIALVLALRRR